MSRLAALTIALVGEASDSPTSPDLTPHRLSAERPDDPVQAADSRTVADDDA